MAGQRLDLPFARSAFSAVGSLNKEVLMAEEGKIYVCDVCGQEVKVTKSGAGTLVCCNVAMHANSA